MVSLSFVLIKLVVDILAIAFELREVVISNVGEAWTLLNASISSFKSTALSVELLRLVSLLVRLIKEAKEIVVELEA